MIKDIFERVKNKTLSKFEAQQAIEKIQQTTQSNRQLTGLKQAYHYDDPYVRDHQVLGERLVLGVTHCSLAINAFVEEFSMTLLGGMKNISFMTPIRLALGEQVKISVVLNVEQQCHFMSTYQLGDQPTSATSAKGELVFGRQIAEPIDLNLYRSQMSQNYRGDQIYAALDNVVYGRALYTIDEVQAAGDQAVAKLSVKKHLLTDKVDYLCHPALLDGALLSAMSGFLFENEQKTFIPFFIEALNFYQPLGDSVVCVSHITQQSDELIKCDLVLCDDNGQVLLAIKGFTCKRVNG